jgi:hypothetical protein
LFFSILALLPLAPEEEAGEDEDGDSGNGHYHSDSDLGAAA